MEEGIGSWMWILLIVLLAIAYWYLSKPTNIPPGSAGLPIVGYLPFISPFLNKTFEKLGKKYGNIFHLYFGSRLIIILNDYEAVHEAFINQAEVFSGRPPDTQFQENKNERIGIISSDGEFWKQHRRFILTNLRDYGVGKLALEPLLLNEIQHFLAELRKNAGKNYMVKPLLSNTIANNIHILVTGKRYDYEDPLMKQLFALFKLSEENIPSVNLHSFFPWLKYVPGSNLFTKREIIKKLTNDFQVLIGSLLETVKSEYTEGQKENYVHAYLTERDNRKKNSKDEPIFTEIGLLHNTQDLIFAGTETTATTLHWVLLYMTLHPQVQKKVQAEIDRVIGSDREPSYNDRSQMPYTEATIMELHRIISLAPIGVPHRATRDTSLFGYFIPKDTTIFANIYAVHHSKKIWGDPENFRPERFLNENGQVIKSEHLIPFSIGKRACVGEPLARMELFLYFVSLLQHFQFIPPDGEKTHLKIHRNPLRRPQFQWVKFVPRS